MRSLSQLLLIVVFVMAGSAAAQDRPLRPQPGPEHHRLGYFVGTWRTEGEVMAGAFGPGGRFTSTDRGEWLEGGFFVANRATSTLPTGSQTQLDVLGWDARQKVYTFSSFNSAGIRLTATGVFEGNTWTWTSTEVLGSQTLQLRHVITVMSPSEFTFRFETSKDGLSWTQFIEGRARKVQ